MKGFYNKNPWWGTTIMDVLLQFNAYDVHVYCNGNIFAFFFLFPKWSYVWAGRKNEASLKKKMCMVFVVKKEWQTKPFLQKKKKNNNNALNENACCMMHKVCIGRWHETPFACEWLPSCTKYMSEWCNAIKETPIF